MSTIQVNKCVDRNEDRISIPLYILMLQIWLLAKIARKCAHFPLKGNSEILKPLILCNFASL